MDKMMKRITAVLLALVLAMGQIVLPTMASDVEPEAAVVNVPIVASEPDAGVPGTVDVPTVPGGKKTEEVDITVSTDVNGNVTAEMSTTPAGGDTTASGAVVNYTSTEESDGLGNASETSQYDAVAVVGDTTYNIEGGAESETKVSEPTQSDDLTVDLVDENGSVVSDAAAGGETSSDLKPTDADSNLKKDDAANFDQTETTTTERQLEVTAVSATTVTGDPVFVDENGESLPVTEDGYNYSGAVKGQTTSYNVKWYEADEDGSKGEGVNGDGSNVREWKVTDERTGEVTRGLYCVDASTNTMPFGLYRIANLEDAVEENYYTVEEAEHLRAAAALGYSWKGTGEDNLDEFNQRLQEAGVLAEGEALTAQQAAAATNMAIWKYGNRYDVDSKDLIPELVDSKGNPVADDVQALVMKAFSYLDSQTMKAPESEKQIINEEKFIEDMTFTVGTKAEDRDENKDNDSTNDVYNTTLKFSMVVTPDKKSDDLIVKVMDAHGNVVKEARIAGENEADENYEYAKTETDENGKTYYVLEGMQLSENQNTVFNLKLEGTQLLEKGVYVFESKNLTVEEAARQYSDYTGADYDKTLEWLKNDPFYAGLYTDSQNFISAMEGTADVDVTTHIDLTFNVEEETITTTRTWRKETSSAPEGRGRPEPRIGNRPLNELPEEALNEIEGVAAAAAEGDGLIILDEEVPLAAVPATGDASLIWSVMGLLSMGCTSVLSRKLRKTEEEEA